MAISITSLVTTLTKSQILAKGLAVAEAIGLPVTSWSAGDPTRSLYHYAAEILESLGSVITKYAGSTFLDYADADWLPVLAFENYDVTARPASYATATITLTNTRGGDYTFDAGDVVAKNTATGKTYHSTAGGHLAPGPGTTLTIDVEADESGSASSAAIGEIDDLVTTFIGVTVTNPTAAVGEDAEEPDALRDRCRAETGTVSPNGPRDAYRAIALDTELTGPTNVTRVRSIGDSDTGDIAIYLASPSGPVSEADRAAVELAIATYATPLTITPTVAIAAAVVTPVTYQLWLYRNVNQSIEQVTAAVNAALVTLFKTRPIGGDVIPPAAGALYVSLIESTIREVFGAFAFRVSIATPAADVALTSGQVATLGTVTPTITFVEVP